MRENNLKIHPGNQLPNHDNFVNVVIKAIDDSRLVAGLHNRRLGKRSWMCWENVVMWQEMSLEERELWKTKSKIS